MVLQGNMEFVFDFESGMQKSWSWDGLFLFFFFEHGVRCMGIDWESIAWYDTAWNCMDSIRSLLRLSMGLD